MTDLVERIIAALPDRELLEVEEPAGTIRVAVVGRPNAGKSSLVNRLLGEQRMLTSDVPGTTRDAIDSFFEFRGHPLVLIDTAGLRKKRQVASAPERHAVFSAVRALRRAHVAVLLVDSPVGPGEQDAKIAGLAVDRGCALVVAPNKCDLLRGEDAASIAERTREVLSFAPYAPLVRISAATGRGVNDLLAAVLKVAEEHDRRVSTGELNRFFEDLVLHHPPPLRGGRPVKLYYASQVAVRPPKFVISCNYPDAVHFSYQRFIMNRLREQFGYDGTPMRLVFKGRARKDAPGSGRS
jgi:GTP-binding protein